MLLWIPATLCAFFVKGLCGFANTLVFTTILSFGTNNINITPVELVMGYPANLIMTWKERRAIRWRESLPIAALILLGSVPGMLFLKNTDASLIKIVFGILIILLGLEMLFRDLFPRTYKESRVFLVLIAVLSGILCGLYGIGALLSAYFGRISRDTHEFKANMSLVFSLENTFRILLYSISGLITAASLKRSLLMIPFMLMGLFLGMTAGKYLNEKIAKRVVILLLIVSGAALLINNL